MNTELTAALSAWVDGEAPLRDERDFTPWAEPGWPAWNPASPERAFCEAAGRLAAHTEFVIETGVGQGYTTRRLTGATVVHAYESWPELRQAIRPYLPDNVHLSEDPTPPLSVLSTADLFVLDSTRPYRPRELREWAKHGHASSLCFIHDTGNGHQPHHWHMQTQELIRSLDVRGILYGNPRGCALLWKARPNWKALELVRLPMLEWL